MRRFQETIILLYVTAKHGCCFGNSKNVTQASPRHMLFVIGNWITIPKDKHHAYALVKLRYCFTSENSKMLTLALDKHRVRAWVHDSETQHFLLLKQLSINFYART